jgi:hypothetical protein
MARKKVVKKKSASKKKVSKKVARKTVSKAPVKNLTKKSEKTTKLLLTSIIIFALSYILYKISPTETLLSYFSAFIAILSGAVILTSIVIELVLAIIRKRKSHR